MKRKTTASPPVPTLRRRAEVRLRAQREHQRQEIDAQRPLQELQIHQIELEMQNAELQDTRDRMEELVEKYTDLYDFAPVGYFSLDEQGLILEGNLMGAALLGMERARLVDRPLAHFIAPASQPAFRAFLQRVFAGTAKQLCDAELGKKDGASIWARFRGISATAESGSKSWCRVAVSDISSLVRAEEILRRNETLFTALIQQAPVGVYVVDEQMRLTQVNATARPIFLRIRPLLGRDFYEVIHLLWPKKAANEIFARFQHTLKTGLPYGCPDFTAQRQGSGTTESYDFQLQRISLPAGHLGVACFFREITAQKRAEENRRRVAVLAASNRKLEREIVRRRTSEKALKLSQSQLRRSLEESHRMQGQLRHLSRQVLRAQEEERKRISRELHDEIAQTLVGINVQLSSLTQTAAAHPAHLPKNVARTQKLVEDAVDRVHRFARELRPTLLDDLGLIPALRSHLQEFSERTKIPVDFTAFAGVARLGSAGRTVLYRVAQSALANIVQHARATTVEMTIKKMGREIRLEVHDNGRAFDVQEVLFAKRHKRLGIIGMRERVEMIGGTFRVASAAGQGTTISARIPFTRAGGRPR